MASRFKNFQPRKSLKKPATETDRILDRAQQDIATTFRQFSNVPLINGILLENVKLTGGDSGVNDLILLRGPAYGSPHELEEEDWVYLTDFNEIDYEVIYNEGDMFNYRTSSPNFYNYIKINHSGIYEISWKIYVDSGNVTAHWDNREAIFRIDAGLRQENGSPPNDDIHNNYLSISAGGPFNNLGDTFFEGTITRRIEADPNYNLMPRVFNYSPSNTINVSGAYSSDVEDNSFFRVKMLVPDEAPATKINTISTNLGRIAKGAIVVKADKDPKMVMIRSTRDTIIVSCEESATCNLWVF